MNLRKAWFAKEEIHVKGEIETSRGFPKQLGKQTNKQKTPPPQPTTTKQWYSEALTQDNSFASLQFIPLRSQVVENREIKNQETREKELSSSLPCEWLPFSLRGKKQETRAKASLTSPSGISFSFRLKQKEIRSWNANKRYYLKLGLKLKAAGRDSTLPTQGYAHFNVHVNHLGILLKSRLWLSGFGGACDCVFNSFRSHWCCWPREPLLV